MIYTKPKKEYVDDVQKNIDRIILYANLIIYNLKTKNKAHETEYNIEPPEYKISDYIKTAYNMYRLEEYSLYRNKKNPKNIILKRIEFQKTMEMEV